MVLKFMARSKPKYTPPNHTASSVRPFWYKRLTFLAELLHKMNWILVLRKTIYFIVFTTRVIIIQCGSSFLACNLRHTGPHVYDTFKETHSRMFNIKKHHLWVYAFVSPTHIKHYFLGIMIFLPVCVCCSRWRLRIQRRMPLKLN